MASSSKIFAFCLCLMLASFGVLVEGQDMFGSMLGGGGHKHGGGNSGIETLLAAGVIASLLQHHGGGGHHHHGGGSGRSASWTDARSSYAMGPPPVPYGYQFFPHGY